MIFSLNGLIRGLIYLTIVTCVTAIGIHRLAPRASHFRILKRTTMMPVNGYHFRSYDRLPRFFDPETGRLDYARLDRVDSFDCATCSPWENDQGQSDVVGRWLGRNGDGVCRGFGLARFKFPDGKVLDRVRLSVMPVSPPCFDPDRPSNVLFASGNGALYRYQFQGNADAPFPAGDEEVAPTPVTWRIATAGETPIAVNDPTWPTDPRLGGRILASFMFAAKDSTGRAILRSRLGWFRLNSAGTEVVESGPLIERAPTTAPPNLGLEETLPMLGSSADGTELTLAYLTHEDGERGWTLRSGPLEIRASGIPIVEASRVRVVAAQRSHVLPVFSADGRTLYSLANSEPKPEAMEAIALPVLNRRAPASLATKFARPGRVVAK